MVKGACMVKGGMCGEVGACVVCQGGMHGCLGACVVAGGACMVKGGMHGKGGCMVKGACVGYDEIWRYNQ